ncbi:hypothetical protein VTN77DRAFT_1542 [Rasamsonia byssochlamydoides]|uniref:uncharacterized protein n=1 Tax=Rasamsonia byssochlamydoides TaxID=89139 RepID=UPI003744A6BD
MARGKDVSELMFRWIIDELGFKAKIAKYTDAVNIHNGDVVKSDSTLLLGVADALEKAIKPLEKMSEYALRYHLGTSEVGRDYYVHPSFFPLVYGRSRVLRDRVIGLDDAISSIGQGEIIAIPADPGIQRSDMSWRIASRADVDVKPFSSNIQWLPFDVLFRTDGSCYIASYINNVHPIHHRDVYRIVEKVLDKVIGMWNVSLTPLKDMLHSRSRIEYSQAQYEKVNSSEEASEYPRKTTKETENEFQDRMYNWRKGFYTTIQPEPGKFAPIATPVCLAQELPPNERNKHRIEAQMDLKNEYGGRGLQVILRILQFTLKPDGPEVLTDWHVEGQMVCPVLFPSQR